MVSNDHFKRWIRYHTDRLVGKAYLLAALIYGSLFLLGGLVLLLHHWLAWWIALLIAGSVIIAAGVLFQVAMNVVAAKE